MSKSTLTFNGGVEGVTGSNFLLEVEGVGQLLVDCGMFQSLGAYEKNREPFPYSPAKISAVLVTHAHIDHIGRIPKLVKDGFTGKIFSTRQTKEIAAIMFEDALKIMTEDVARRGNGAQALYGQADVIKSLSLWETRQYHETFEALPGVTTEFLDAGHILGSAMVRVSRAGRRIVFTGDIGNSPSPIVRDAEVVTGANYLVIDSTYGDRTHESRENAEQKFASVVVEAIRESKTLLIPVFSLERAHIVLYLINNLVENGAISPIPVFLDSPLASRLMPIYESSKELFNQTTQEHFARGDDIFSFPKLKIVQNNVESGAIEKSANPKIIIAGSGMSVGGRIPAHEINLLPDPNTTLLITGYQAVGTLGRTIADGAKEVIINNQSVQVRAKIGIIEGFSAHKDSAALLEFIEKSQETLEQIFVVHGEPKSSLFLVQRIRDYLGLNAIGPEKEQGYMIEF